MITEREAKMKNKSNPPNTQRKNPHFAFTQIITTLAFPLLIEHRKMRSPSKKNA